MNNYSKDVSTFYGFNSESNDITEKNAFANFVEQVGTLIQKGLISKEEANQVFLAMLLIMETMRQPSRKTYLQSNVMSGTKLLPLVHFGESLITEKVSTILFPVFTGTGRQMSVCVISPVLGRCPLFW